jgi:glycosyltransferase involved in cell wall biosynthesis
VADRVRFLGRVAHEKLPEVYGAADALVLASEREGWPNVLLEAMACGTPVVATRVGGVPEIVQGRDAGALVGERTSEAIAAALRDLLASPPARAMTRRYAEGFGWEATTAGQISVFRDAMRGTVEARTAHQSESACASS